MKLRRRYWALIVVAVVLLALAVVIALHRHAAPETVRLLPEADSVAYLNLRNVRLLTSFSSQSSADREPAYDRFVRETGIEWERDLDEAALAVHAGLANGENRYSEILVGHFNHEKLANYLRSISRSMENYRQVDIYSIPVENRTLRVALIGLDAVAASNVDDASVIHGVIDRYKEAALPFGGPSLVRDYYKHVPFGSLAWIVGRVPANPQNPRQQRTLSLPGGIDVFVPANSNYVASVRVLTTLRARFELIAPSEDEAQKFTAQANTLLNLFETLQQGMNLSGNDAEMKSALTSLKAAQDKKSAVLTAEIPVNLLKKVFAAAPSFNQPAPPATTQQTAPGTKGKTEPKVLPKK